MSYEGCCACDGVRIRIDGSPVSVRQCWCRHCQQLSGGGPTHNAIFETNAITFEGEVRWNAHDADSGNGVQRLGRGIGQVNGAGVGGQQIEGAGGDPFQHH